MRTKLRVFPPLAYARGRVRDGALPVEAVLEAGEAFGLGVVQVSALMDSLVSAGGLDAHLADGETGE